MSRATLPVAALLAGCAASGVTVPADACRGAAVPELVGRNVGEVRFAAGLPHRIVIPGSEGQPATPGTLLVRVDEKGWIRRVGCASPAA